MDEQRAQALISVLESQRNAAQTQVAHVNVEFLILTQAHQDLTQKLADLETKNTELQTELDAANAKYEAEQRYLAAPEYKE